MIDAILAKTVPIYIGPSLEKFAFLLRCVYQCDPNVKSILHILTNNDSDEYLQKKKYVEELDINELEIFTKKYNFNKLAKINKEYLLNH